MLASTSFGVPKQLLSAPSHALSLTLILKLNSLSATSLAGLSIITTRSVISAPGGGDGGGGDGGGGGGGTGLQK